MLLLVSWVVGLALIGVSLWMRIPGEEPERAAVLPPPPAEHEPFPLILPARAGWDTCMNLALTTVFRPSWAGEPIVPHRCVAIR